MTQNQPPKKPFSAVSRGIAAEATTDFPDVQITDRGELRYLYLDSPWVQGVMSLKAPHILVHDYAQHMMLWLLFANRPRRIAQFGLGAGSLTRFCQHYFPQADIDVLEPNPKVIEAAHRHFFIPTQNAQVHIHQQCAEQFLHGTDDEQYDLLQVDAYGAEATEPVLGGADFYAHCARSLRPNGLLTINLLGNFETIHQHIHELNQSFAATAWLPETEDGNLIAIAFKQAPEVEFDDLYKRAARIESQYQLPATLWVRALEDWMLAGSSTPTAP